MKWIRDWIEYNKYLDAVEWVDEHDLVFYTGSDYYHIWIDFTTIADCVLFKLSCQDLLPWN